MIASAKFSIREQRPRPFLLVGTLAMIGGSHQARTSTIHRNVPAGRHPQEDRGLRSLAIKIEGGDAIAAADMPEFWHMLQPQLRNSVRLNTEIARNFLIGEAKIGQSDDRRRRIWAQNLARFKRACRTAWS